MQWLMTVEMTSQPYLCCRCGWGFQEGDQGHPDPVRQDLAGRWPTSLRVQEVRWTWSPRPLPEVLPLIPLYIFIINWRNKIILLCLLFLIQPHRPITAALEGKLVRFNWTKIPYRLSIATEWHIAVDKHTINKGTSALFIMHNQYMELRLLSHWGIKSQCGRCLTTRWWQKPNKTVTWCVKRPNSITCYVPSESKIEAQQWTKRTVQLDCMWPFNGPFQQMLTSPNHQYLEKKNTTIHFKIWNIRKGILVTGLKRTEMHIL